MVDKGQEIECKVLSVDQQRRRIALGLKQMQDDPWTADIPDRYKVDDVVHGTITKITNFGVFVGLEDGLEGLLHISELSDDKVENAEELVQVGDPIDVKILRVDIEERKIGLSKKQVSDSETSASPETASPETASPETASPETASAETSSDS
jgi:small subunit ribosomal protein S1